MTAANRPFEARRDDFAWCEEIIQRHSQSFYAAFSMLPTEKRLSVYAIYTFCRFADDCVDEAASRGQLASLRDELDRFVAGSTPNAPMWRALAVVFQHYNLDSRPFYDMLAGQERDLAFRQPESLEELEDYCYYVAGSVGLMLLPVLCHQSGNLAFAKNSAVALGVAMQLTNILRDVGEDLARGRVYLPAGMMREQGYSSNDLNAHRVNKPFIRLWEALARRAEGLYKSMECNIHLLDEDSCLPTLSALYLYRGILDEVRAKGYDCFTTRSFVPDGQKRRLVARAEATLSGWQAPATQPR